MLLEYQQIVILTIAMEGSYNVRSLLSEFAYFFLLLIFPRRLYVNYPLTVTAGEGEMACSKGHCPMSYPAQGYPLKEGGVRDASNVYRMFVAEGFSVLNKLQTMANRTRANLDNAPDIGWTPK